MESVDVSVQIEGLSKIDLLELEREFPSERVKLHTVNESEHAFGEPGTILGLITVGTLLLPPLLLWLAKRRWGFTLEEDETVTLPDGTKVTRRVRVKIRKSSPPSADEIKALNNLKSVDLKAIAQALDTGGDPG